MIPQSFIQELLNRLDIVDVVERYLPLKKAGANYVACCPFHKEKSPSFSVSQSKQFYHCFGCGAHGSAISFVMEYQGLGFPEAVEELARNIGISVPQERAEPAQVSRLAADAGLPQRMQQALNYYREQLKKSSTAINYLKGRGLSGEIAARFGLGYAPSGWQNLAEIYTDYAEAASVLETGLVIENEEGRRYDRFRDRVLFPILNSRGNVIGFGGRVIGVGEPKYLNSPETALFQKGQELYGMFQARQAIRAQGKVLVVEGYMDVVALAQHGVEYAVATLGTATTPMHIQKLLRVADEIIFCFDGDAAGQRAAWRALENSLSALTDSSRLLFLFLPESDDPDSYIRREGKGGFEARYNDSLTLSQFLVKELTRGLDLTTSEGRAKLVQSAKPMLDKIVAPALQLLLRKQLAELSGVSVAELNSLVPRAPSAKPQAGPIKPRRQPSLARKLLRMVLQQPELGRTLDYGPGSTNDFDERSLQALLALLREQPHITSYAAIVEAFRGSEEAPVLADIANETWMADADFDVAQEFAGALAQLEAAARQKRIDSLLALARTQPLDAEQKQTLARELAAGRGV